MGLLSSLASRRHIVPYANPEASASCGLVRRARRRAALILFSLGATVFIVTKSSISASHTRGRLRSRGVDLEGGHPWT